MPENSEEYKDFFLKDGSIDWDRYFACKTNSKDAAHKFLHHLLSIGKLSTEVNGHWLIASPDRCSVNPNIGSIKLYFAEKDEAMRYANSRHPNCLICHVDQAIRVSK
ncbi:MAG TPA: hypothetical protein PLK35_03330 [Candidatus Moranbacteria bacterium]|nr:hypothetical protein [Candidatus Moranbacteria bacterium]